MANGKLTGKGKLCHSNVKVPALGWKITLLRVYCGFRRLKSRKWLVSDKVLAQNFPLLPQKSISQTNPASCYSEPCGKIAHLT
jgi:hypothetical protein|tara:strand:- start:194 stop:442 length:249 start_codon:yes stop_codon:yes gene_type:complete